MKFKYNGHELTGTRAEITELLKFHIDNCEMEWKKGHWYLGIESLAEDLGPSFARKVMTDMAISRIPEEIHFDGKIFDNYSALRIYLNSLPMSWNGWDKFTLGTKTMAFGDHFSDVNIIRKRLIARILDEI